MGLFEDLREKPGRFYRGPDDCIPLPGAHNNRRHYEMQFHEVGILFVVDRHYLDVSEKQSFTWLIYFFYL